MSSFLYMKVAVQDFCSFTVVFGGHGAPNRSSNRVIKHSLRDMTILQGFTTGGREYTAHLFELTQFYGTIMFDCFRKYTGTEPPTFGLTPIGLTPNLD